MRLLSDRGDSSVRFLIGAFIALWILTAVCGEPPCGEQPQQRGLSDAAYENELDVWRQCNVDTRDAQVDSWR